MPVPRALRPGEAARTLAHRLGTRLAPRLLQLATRFGIRPYRVSLVWSKWSGEERGDGTETIVAKVELIPTPLVDMSGVSYEVTSVGRVPSGSISVREVALTYTADQLMGFSIPEKHEDTIPEPYDFYYEVTEDDRGDPLPQRSKFRLAKQPFRDAEKLMWILSLERMSEDNDRHGKSQIG